MTNCVLWGDKLPEVEAGFSATITYSDVQGGWEGAGNIDANPLFTPDWHLRAGSPCRNAGDPDGEYDNFGLCNNMEEVEAYTDSPYCHDVEIVYDSQPKSKARSSSFTDSSYLCPYCKAEHRYSEGEHGKTVICGECEDKFVAGVVLGGREERLIQKTRDRFGRVRREMGLADKKTKCERCGIRFSLPPNVLNRWPCPNCSGSQS